jgi:manganese oxidase
MNGDWKEFHLVAEPLVREFAPGMKVNLWGYNGQAPGPTIEAVEGDKVRIFVTNKLPEHTTSQRHGRGGRGDAAAHQAATNLCL